MTRLEKQAGLVAGLSLVAMAVAAGFSYGYVYNGLVAETAEMTWKNINGNQSLFLAGLVGWAVIFITDIIVAAALFVFFRNTNERISLLTAAIRIVYTLVLGVAIYRLFAIVPVFSVNLSDTELQMLLNGFDKTWSIGLIIFGFHLAGLGFLSLKNQSVPGFLSYLLYFAGFSYTFLHVAKNFNTIPIHIVNRIEIVLSMPMALGELMLAVWLIYKALKLAS